MAPPIRPACSESAPRVALTVVRLWGSSLRGRAPEEISGARFSASAWVWPVMTAEPPLMPLLHWTSEATGG
jgi:hypothetical protein